MLILSASELYAHGAKVGPVTVATVDADSHCVMCGAYLPAGSAATAVDKHTFSSAFNNRLDLRALSGRYVCGYCQALWGKDWLQKYSKTYATLDGVWKFASNEHQAAFFLRPPEPPFAVIFSTRQQQHMIWRTPVSQSNELYTVRVDGDLLSIRQKRLMDGLAAYNHLLSIMATTPHPVTGKKLKPPAALFSRELASSVMGSVRADVEELARSTGDDDAVATLNSLSMGEWFALNAIRNFDPDKPPEPARALNEDGTPIPKEPEAA